MADQDAIAHRVVLASASPARLATLRSAGIEPDVIISGVDERAIVAENAAELALELATLKARAVAERVGPAMVIGCDSVLEIGGRTLGKPADVDEAHRRWRAMRGKTGVLHTGHCLIDTVNGREVRRCARTVVHFAAITDAEIEAYVATGEPLHVAGAFTIDGRGGAFIRGIEGDPHNVIGISLPLLRLMFVELGVVWTDLWQRPQ